MQFTFVHTADWQIGKPFRHLPASTAALVEAARLDAIDRLADVARAHGAAHVLVAGDVYDAESLPSKTLRQPLERMSRHSAITWHLLPGNHDPARAGGLWARLATIGLPANVRALVEPAACDLAAGVALLPAPLRAKAQSTDPTAWFDGEATPDGVARVGLAHGSIQDFGEVGEAAACIDPARARKAGLSYLALGDWHGVQRIDERTWYAGTPEPDRFRANEPGFALVVRLDGPAAPPNVERVATSRFVWLKLAARLAHIDELGGIEQHIATAGVPPQRVLVDLSLSGALSLADRARLDAWREVQEGRLAHIQIDTKGLVLAAQPEDLAFFGEAGELRDAAAHLKAIADADGHARRDIAAAALVRLAEETQRAREAGP